MRQTLPSAIGADVRPHGGDVARLLRPKSIAIVGATVREGAFGARLLASIKSSRYSGRVYPINPRYETIDGLACYPSLAAVPEKIDLAAFAVSDDIIETSLAEAASAGVGAAAIFGRAYEPDKPGMTPKPERIAAIARGARMAVCGINCMGFVNFVDGLKISGNPPPIPDEFGGIGLLSHSGSTWSGLVGNQRQLMFNYAVSAGAETATTMADYMDFLTEQPETRVVACILETVRDPERFIAALERADRKGIPVVALKLGRTERGRRFALAHSGALAGSDAAYGAIFEQYNVVRVHTVDELADTAELLSAPRRPGPGGIGMVTDSGGERELIVDIATDTRTPLADLTPETSAKLAGLLDPGMSAVNPVDSYGDGRMLIGEVLELIAKDGNVAIAAMATNLVSGRSYLYAATAALEKVNGMTDKPTIVFGNIHSTVNREEAARLRAKGIPVLMGTTTSLLAMKHALAWRDGRTDGARRSTPPRAEAPASVREIAGRSRAGTALPPRDALAILDYYGIPSARCEFVGSPGEAAAAAERIGIPVVAKTAAADVLHKTEKGGVAVNLGSRSAVTEAYARICATCGPEVQIQRQIAAGTEILLGMSNDAQFGPMVTIGLGGVLTELLGDVVTFVPPVTADGAVRLLQRLKGYRLLDGFRGRPKANIAALAAVIERFSRLCHESGPLFAEIDINPVIAGSEDAIAVDALLISKPVSG